jgi:uncharacterized protein (UPF0335 family)
VAKLREQVIQEFERLEVEKMTLTKDREAFEVYRSE